MFKEADKDSDSELTLDDCQDFLEKHNIKIKDNIQTLFKKSNVDGSPETLSLTGFLNFICGMFEVPELDTLFMEYSDQGRMTARDLSTFLSIEQRMNVTEDECMEFMHDFQQTSATSTSSRRRPLKPWARGTMQRPFQRIGY